MTNPVGFYLGEDVLDYVYERRMLDKVKLVNQYIRSFTLGLTKEQVAAIEDAGKRKYFLDCIDDSVVYPLDWEGWRLTGAAHSAMMTALQRFIESRKQSSREAQLLLGYCVSWCVYVVTNTKVKYGLALSAIREAVDEMPEDSFYRLYHNSPSLQKVWYKGIKDELAEDVSQLEVISPARCEELVDKLVEYSTNPDATLAAELKQKQRHRSQP